MTEIIKDELENYYENLIIEIEYKQIRTYNIYISIPLTDWKNKDIIKSIQFEFIWNAHGTKESNINQLRYKINRSIVQLFLKG